MSSIASIVSIHAPVQAGDFALLCLNFTGYMFQSTPPYKRATQMMPKWATELVSFNPRPRTSGRRKFSAALIKSIIVSIHAPVQAGD